jgi:hypothetical protein
MALGQVKILSKRSLICIRLDVLDIRAILAEMWKRRVYTVMHMKTKKNYFLSVVMMPVVLMPLLLLLLHLAMRSKISVWAWEKRRLTLVPVSAIPAPVPVLQDIEMEI